MHQIKRFFPHLKKSQERNERIIDFRFHSSAPLKMSKQLLEGIVSHYKEKKEKVEVSSIESFFKCLEKDNKNIDIQFMNNGTYGMIFLFSYFHEKVQRKIVIKFSLIYEDENPNSQNLSTNVEHIIYGALNNVMQNYQLQNIVIPFYSFLITFEDFEKSLLSFFEKDKKVEKARSKFHPTKKAKAVNCLVMEYVDKSLDLLKFVQTNFSQLTLLKWKVLFFQIIFALHVVQYHFPDFKHNDLKPNNILIQEQAVGGNKSYNCFLRKGNAKEEAKFRVPRQGFIVKLSDFDFSSIKNIVENDKVNARWSDKFFINKQPNRYQDIHYLFMHLQSGVVLKDFLNVVPQEVREFVEFVVPSQFKTSQIKQNNNRLTESTFKEYLTPQQLLEHEFFAEFRLPTPLTRSED